MEFYMFRLLSLAAVSGLMGCAVEEGNTIDRPDMQRATGDAPDLHVSNVTPSLTDDGWYFDVTVTNLGAADAEEVLVVVFPDQDSPPAPNEYTDQVDWFEVLPAGASATVTLRANVECEGGCTTWVALDVFDDIAETDETNNLWGPFEIRDEWMSADLAVMDVTTTQDTWGWQHRVVVENLGDAQSPPVDLYWYPDHEGAPEVDEFGSTMLLVTGASLSEGLKPGERWEWVVTADLEDCLETCTGWLQVDTTDAVSESDESNNLWGPVLMEIVAP
jgi:hypothetical protein